MMESFEGVVTVTRISWALKSSMFFQTRRRSSRGNLGKRVKAGRGANEVAPSDVVGREEVVVLEASVFSLPRI
jgi:hypothetical protein